METNISKKISNVLKKYNIEKFQNSKVDNTLRWFNLILIIDILIIAICLGLIIGILIL